MKTEKLVQITGFLMLAVFIIGNVISLIRVDYIQENMGFGPEIAGKYSIFASRGAFIAYNVWGIVVAVLTGYAFYKKIRILFLIGMLLMIILLFYPYFTAGPDSGRKTKTAQPDSTQVTIYDTTQAVDTSKVDTILSGE